MHFLCEDGGPNTCYSIVLYCNQCPVGFLIIVDSRFNSVKSYSLVIPVRHLFLFV